MNIVSKNYPPIIIVRLDNLLATKGAMQAPINVASPTKLVPI